ncbi:MAG: LLM class F420-dependent oxidoreductase [Alphaproteobacteria bacterium]|nr:LLM class F420-dependent oxidoreductase [Alphaproteobacteria bacterium]
MKLGVALPIVDIGGEPAALREFAQAAEAIGYHGIAAPDHVLGANVASRPDWTQPRARSTDLYHDPFVLFGFLAGCTNIGDLSTQVLILPQRQTVLVAKQASSLDVLSGGRFRLGIGVGWNEIEFVGLNQNFRNRGRRSEEQVEVMRALWAEPHASFKGTWHTIEDAGINPLPTGRKIPLWYGGHADVTLRRCARWGDGWMPLAYPPGEEAKAAIATLRRYTEEAGRDPATIGIDTRVSAGAGSQVEWHEEVRLWKSIGVTHLTLANYYEGGHLHRITGRSLGDHIRSMEQYWKAVADLL